MLKAKSTNQSSKPQPQTIWGYIIPPYSICSIQSKPQPQKIWGYIVPPYSICSIQNKISFQIKGKDFCLFS